MRRMAFATLLAFSSVVAADRYANPTGSGTTCSSGSPCTLHYCVCGAESGGGCAGGMAAGDTCWLQDGTYTDSGLWTKSTSCSAGSPCKLAAVNSGAATVEITTDSGSTYFYWSNADYWTIDGIIWKHTGGTNSNFFRMTGGDHVTVKNSQFLVSPSASWTDAAEFYGCTNCLIQASVFRREPTCQQNCATVGSCTTSGALACDFQCDGSAIVMDGGHDNIVETSQIGYYRNPGVFKNMANATCVGGANNGLRCGTPDGVSCGAGVCTGDGTTTLTLRKNLCRQENNHGCFQINDVSGVLAENNINTADLAAGCSGDVSTGPNGDFIDSYCGTYFIIRNNTFATHNSKSPQSQYIYMFGSANNACSGADGGPNGSGLDMGSNVFQHWKVYNNIFYDLTTASSCGLCLEPVSGTTPTFQSDYNLFNSNLHDVQTHSGSTTTYSLATWKGTAWDGVFANDNNSVSSAPPFVTYTSSSEDLHLSSQLAGAPFADATFPCPSEDYAGTARATTCTMGAYQYTGGGSSRRRFHLSNPK